ncbi:hypothetical protein B566_EDAN004925 [Ephemera danica]|nr:hypothetical protein B566_EDAN004925 [Ephemera danica]
MADLQGFVTRSEVASLLGLHDEQIENVHVAPAIVDVPGFSSLILRVTITLYKGSKRCLIVKRLPLDGYLLDVVDDTDVFTREVHFFQHALPLLQNKVSSLPIVKCLAAQPDRIIMEDLSEKGYRILANSMADIGKNPLNFDQLKLVMEKLACFHAASIDMNWLEILPHLKTDTMLENASCPFPTLLKKACQAYATAMDHFYPKVDSKYSKWLRSAKPMECLLKLVKPDTKYTNMLGHADLWVNNIMFRINSDSGQPEDAIFIDFQMCRYVPVSRDIQNLLYTCTTKEFRDTYEMKLLLVYVHSFNDTLGYERLSLQELKNEYNDSRLFGMMVGIVFRSMNLMSDLYPAPGEEMSNEMFETMLSGNHFDGLLQRCSTEEFFNRTVHDFLGEFVQILDKHHIY